MQKKIGIYFFSGSGNTEEVVKLLGSSLGESSAECVIKSIPRILDGKENLEIDQFNMIGFASPVHAWDLPRIMYDFMRLLSDGKGTPAFILKTAAGYSSTNNGAGHELAKKLKKKNYDVFYDRLIVMGCNWMFKYDDRLTKQLYEAAKDKARHMADEILDIKSRSLPLHPLLHFFFRIAYMGEDIGARLFGRELKTGANCNNCGKCVRECPTHNIRETQGKIRFGWNCMMCMKCVYGCPQDAIAPRLMKFLKVKGGYNIRKIIDDPNIRSAYVTENTRGYYSQFYPYVKNPDL